MPPHHSDNIKKKVPVIYMERGPLKRPDNGGSCRGKKTDNVGSQHVVAISYGNDKTRDCANARAASGGALALEPPRAIDVGPESSWKDGSSNPYFHFSSKLDVSDVRLQI